MTGEALLLSKAPCHKAYMGSRSKYPQSISTLSFMFRLLYPHGKDPSTYWTGGSVGPGII